MFFYSSYERYSRNNWSCALNLPGIKKLATAVKDALMTSFIPIPIIITVQVLSYRELLKSINGFDIRYNHIRRSKKVAQTFKKITISFFLLTTPAVVYFVFVQYLGRFHHHIILSHRELFSTLPRCFNIFVAINSCVNPFLYSKIQRRFTRKREHAANVRKRKTGMIVLPTIL